MIEGKTLYEILGVPEDATHDQIRAAYRALVQRYHPDRYQPKAEAEAITRRLTLAYRTLGRPHARADYDRKLAALRAKAGAGAQQAHQAPPRESVKERPAAPAAESDPSTVGAQSGFGWFLSLVVFAIAVKWFGPLQAVILAPLIGWVWQVTAKHGGATRVLATTGAFVVCTAVAWTFSVMVAKGITPDAVAETAASTPSTAAPSSQPDIVDPFQQAGSMELLHQMRSADVSEEQWAQVLVNFQQANMAGNPSLLNAFNKQIILLHGRYPDATVGDLLTHALERARSGESQAPAPATASSLANATPESHSTGSTRPTTPPPPEEEPMSAEEEYRMYLAEAEQRADAREAEWEAKRQPRQEGWPTSRDPAKVVPNEEEAGGDGASGWRP